jgi:Uma2 family endonuclease
MTAEEFLALPEEEFCERWLIRGRLREQFMTTRNRWHSRVMSIISFLLEQWLERQPEPRGEVVSGEAGFRLGESPDTIVGIDVAYVSHEVSSQTPSNSRLFAGPPVLAVEILSPTDKLEHVQEKVREYLNCGVKIVWIVEPDFQTITVYRPDAEPVLFNRTQTISAEPWLPGFSAAVERVFR